MILRNIGFSDELAILDSHLLRFIGLRGIADVPANNRLTLPVYEMIEAKFLGYARSVGWPTAILDQAIWVVMRVYAKGHA